MEKVSVIVPAFRESELLESVLSRLVKDNYPKKEIISVIDEPTSASIKISRKFKKKVKFILNKKRIGKSKALNLAVKKSSGDILFFLDSDNRINGKSNNTLEKIVKDMDGHDLAELTIGSIKDSFVSKLVGLEFANTTMANIMFSKFAGTKPAIFGAAFVIRKSVFLELGGFRNFIAEDVDLGWRSFEKKKSYKQISSVRISTKAPNNLNEWLSQRNRWVIGTIQWFMRNWKSVSVNLLKQAPHISISSIMIIFPITVLGIMSLFLSESLLEQFIILSLALLPIKIPQITPIVFTVLSGTVILKSIFMYAVGFSISTSLTYMACKLAGEKFSIHNFLVYYFLYTPFMLMMFVYGFVRVAILKNIKLSDWKV